MALVAGASAAALLGGALALLRNVAGMAGVGLLFAAGLGSSLSWIGPMAYLAVAEDALSSGWHMPWTWPARPPDDVGAAICALLVFGAGLVVIARAAPATPAGNERGELAGETRRARARAGGAPAPSELVPISRAGIGVVRLCHVLSLPPRESSARTLTALALTVRL